MVVELNPDPLGLFGIGTLAVVAYTYEAVATNGATGVVGVFYGCTTSANPSLFALPLGVGVSAWSTTAGRKPVKRGPSVKLAPRSITKGVNVIAVVPIVFKVFTIIIVKGRILS